MRGMFEGSDHYVVLAKIKVKGRRESGRKNGKGKRLGRSMKGRYARNRS